VNFDSLDRLAAPPQNAGVPPPNLQSLCRHRPPLTETRARTAARDRGFAHGLRIGTGRRYLTVLFSDLTASVSLGERMRFADYVDMLRWLRQLCRRTIAHHGGHVARLQGDGVMAIFGIPEARFDDGHRAAMCAMALHAAVREVLIATNNSDSRRLALHSGIHASEVHLERGDIERGRFDLVGHAPNIAARLCSLAGSDEIYISEAALGGGACELVTGHRRELPLRGRGELLPVYLVRGRSAGP